MENTQDDSSIEMILQKKFSDLEDIAIKTTQNKSGEKKELKIMNRASLSCGTISGSIIYT